MFIISVIEEVLHTNKYFPTGLYEVKSVQHILFH